MSTAASEPALAKSAAKALKWNYFGLAVRSACSLAIGIVLARMLGPKPFGQVAIATLTISFGALMSDFGFASALVQLKDITREEIRFAFSVQVIFGALMSTVGIGAAGLIARTFHQPDVTPVVRVMMLTFVLQSFGLTAAGLLRRQLHFKQTQIAQVGSYIVAYVCLGIPLAYAGFGVWALVAAQITQVVLNSALMFAFAPHSIIPLLRFDSSRMIKFGGKITFSNMTNWTVLNLDNTFVGRFFGAADLGLYSRAYTLAAIPMNGTVMAMQTVLFSPSSRAQDNLDAVRRAYLAAANVLSAILMPLFAVVAAAPFAVMVGLYGNRWVAAVPLLVPLALAMPLHALLAVAGPVLWGLGRTKELIIAQCVAGASAVGCFWAACRYSNLVSLSWTVLAIYALWCVIVTRVAMNVLKVPVGELVRVVRGPLTFAAVSYVVVYALVSALSTVAAPIQMVCVGFTYCLIAASTLYFGSKIMFVDETVQLMQRSFPAAAKWLRLSTTGNEQLAKVEYAASQASGAER